MVKMKNVINIIKIQNGSIYFQVLEIIGNGLNKKIIQTINHINLDIFFPMVNIVINSVESESTQNGI